jgi:aldehyde:ferredoxin oxidoreductase
LKVDLGSGNIEPLTLPVDFKEMYIGGRGYALKFLWDGTTAHTRYDSPENILVMASGPLGNEPRFPGSGKFVVGTISPLTDTFVDSNIGGHFGPLLKRCGFDALAVTGISRTEAVLVVDGDKGEISLCRAPTFGNEVDPGALSYGNALLMEFTEGRMGESVAAVTTGTGAVHTRFGIINSLFFDRRRQRVRSKQAGRGGTGTVLAQKGLRAVIVHSTHHGTGSNRPADSRGVKETGAKLKKVISQVDSTQLHLQAWGTTGLVEYMNRYHILPIHNYQYGQHPGSEGVFGEIFKKRYFSGGMPDGCFTGCNLACAKGAENVTLTHGPHAGRKVGVDGPEYETVAAVTSMGIFDPHFVMEYNWYCDEYGVDSISLGVTVSFLMECMQRGYLNQEDAGYPLTWGNGDGVNRLLHQTVRGEGLGKICAQGTHRAKQWVAAHCAARSGTPLHEVTAELSKFAMEVKGLEFSMYNTKESLAQQGGYGFALKGPQHDEAWLIFIDQVHEELPTFEMKAKALRWFPLIRTWFNAVGLCKLPWIDVRHPQAAQTDNPSQNQPTLAYYVRYLSATVGKNLTVEDILAGSERLYHLQKLINLRHGKGTRTSDQIPLRAMGPAFINEYEARQDYYDAWVQAQMGDGSLPPDPALRHEMLLQLRQQAYESLCDAVYLEKGYTRDGCPLPETLERFGLLDEKATDLLVACGVLEKERRLSN